METFKNYIKDNSKGYEIVDLKEFISTGINRIDHIAHDETHDIYKLIKTMWWNCEFFSGSISEFMKGITKLTDNKFDKELIDSHIGLKPTLWVCHDYLGDQFLSISECYTLEDAQDTLKEYLDYGLFEEGESGIIEVLEGTPVFIIKKDNTKTETIKELKEFFIKENTI